MAEAEHKNFSNPDDTQESEKAKFEIANIGGGPVARVTFQPGWRWSEHTKPSAGTEWCEVAHFGYQLSGRFRIKMKDGDEFETGPGEIMTVPPGHDGWVVGDEPAVFIDWAPVTSFGK